MPVYCFHCRNCSLNFEELRKIEDRSVTTSCPRCQSGLIFRHHAAEIPRVPGSEIGFSPYFDVGAGKYFKSREEQKAEYSRKGLIPLSKKDLKDSIRLPEKPPPPDTSEAWERAKRKAMKKVAEKKRIVIP